MRLVVANTPTATKRRVYFHLVGTDGITPATGEAGGQPQISSNAGAWTNTGISTLTAIGNGRYSADLTQAAVATAGTIIETRYKSAGTAECPGDAAQVVGIDLDLIGVVLADGVAHGGATATLELGSSSSPALYIHQSNVDKWAVIAENTNTTAVSGAGGAVRFNAANPVGGTGLYCHGATIDISGTMTDVLQTGVVTGDVQGKVLGGGSNGFFGVGVSAQLADAVAHGGTTATLRLGASSATAPFLVTNNAGPAVFFDGSGGVTSVGLKCSGGTFGSASGLLVTGATGLLAQSSLNGSGIKALGNGSSPGMLVQGGTNGDGLQVISGTGTSTTALVLEGNTASFDSATGVAIAVSVYDSIATGHSFSQTFGAILNSLCLRQGTARAGTVNTIQLDINAPASNDYFDGGKVSIVGGTGAGQRGRIVTAYNGATQTATVTPNWVTPPDNTSLFFIAPTTATLPTLTQDEIADTLLGRNIKGGSDGGRTVAEALAASRNKVVFTPITATTGTFIVYDTDDTTPLWNGAYDRGANTLGPLTGVDPN